MSLVGQLFFCHRFHFGGHLEVQALTSREVSHAILLDDRLAWLSQILMIAAHSEEFASRGKKYQTSFIFSSRTREANFSPKIRRTREETAELTASRGILLSSFLHVCGGLNIVLFPQAPFERC